jgi:hypothetical protein
MFDRILAIGGTLAMAVVITALVLPGRQTPSLVTAAGGAFANAARAAEGR